MHGTLLQNLHAQQAHPLLPHRSAHQGEWNRRSNSNDWVRSEEWAQITLMDYENRDRILTHFYPLPCAGMGFS